MDTAYNKNQLEKLTWMDCQAALEKTDTIIIPVGAVEQHGPHLPLGTDWIHAEYASLKAAERCGVIAGPTIKIGVSENHLDFPGTISFKPQTLILITPGRLLLPDKTRYSAIRLLQQPRRKQGNTGCGSAQPED